IINSDILAANKGILKTSELKEIFLKKEDSDFEYPEKTHQYIIDLMLEFKLCYPIDNRTVLVPDLLEVQEPTIEFDYEGSLKFQIQYELLHKSIIPRFIVKMQKDIDKQWRTGVVLYNARFNATSIVKADYEERMIYIEVDGDQRREYFTVIRKALNDINGIFEKIEPRELVPLPDNPKITYELEELVGLERMNKTLSVGRLGKEYIVAEILNRLVTKVERINIKVERIDTRVDTLEKYKHEPTKIENIIHLEQKQEQKQEQTQKQEQILESKVIIDFKFNLQNIISDFKDLKRELSKINNDELTEEIDSINDDLIRAQASNDDNKSKSTRERLFKFLEDLGDEKTKFNKVIKGAKKGVEGLQKIGKLYNKVGQWFGLWRVPDVFLGKK
ncbi:hypothetical protein KKB18_12075, partial [bacterium]|nr:hypothetical protein [bacterium]